MQDDSSASYHRAMPELPEVETVRRGLSPHIVGHRLRGARVRHPRLRWPVPAGLDRLVKGQRITALERRGKYLILGLEHGGLLLHLGMSGSLRLVAAATPPEKHDHVDLLLDSGQALRLRDPRRFGAVLWSEAPAAHPLLASLGIEPLSRGFDGEALYRLSRGKTTAIKHLIMDAHLIVGVGNIYANEALFQACIRPTLRADQLSRPRCHRLAEAIKDTLRRAIKAGGSSLRDFVNGHGEPGYFQQSYFVYGRAGEPCRQCGTTIKSLRQANRASHYCPNCQKG
ncbi:DNA-(apurinic or apyrimidinic site) lyase [Sulfuritortus calidifontis]|uniref:Formamidopyrimidine-DNA glycosylase n=2 Tax=Sulfuritortus calidifontis TaxID=1914471 RepID=A0A4R3JY68_9PROT|nr:DNA-(apurinic or apyrimidinic site) lyase [Sulfuritortus calidifontis]